MLGLALLGAQAALPQHVPHHVNNLYPLAKEGAEAMVLQGSHAHFFQCPVHDEPGVAKKYIHLRLLVLLVARIVIAPIVAHVVVACDSNNITYLLFLEVVLAVVFFGSGGGLRKRKQEHHSSCVM